MAFQFSFYIFNREERRFNLKSFLLLCLPLVFTEASFSASKDTIPNSAPSISIQADALGHYTGTLLINNVRMPFLIDTGATQIVIPRKLSYSARLPLGKAFQSSTANGLSLSRETRIESLKIGNIELNGLDAFTSEHLDHVLFGMNALKYFRMTQDSGILTLTLSSDSLPRATTVPLTPTPLPQMPQPKKTWEKTVTCDENNENCKTSYR